MKVAPLVRTSTRPNERVMGGDVSISQMKLLLDIGNTHTSAASTTRPGGKVAGVPNPQNGQTNDRFGN